MNLLSISSLNWAAVFLSSGVTLVLGLLYKITIVAKQRKRILQLENEMLSNHRQILELEKQLSETISEKNKSQTLTSIKGDLEAKVS